MLAHSDETTTPIRLAVAPGCSVVPSALAAARIRRKRERLIRAVALGTMSAASHRNAGKRNIWWRHTAAPMPSPAPSAQRPPPPAWPGFRRRQMRWLLSYTAQSASGLASWQRTRSTSRKSFDFGGMPARNGITAALLVQRVARRSTTSSPVADNFLEAFKPMNDPGMLIEASVSVTRSCAPM